MVALGWFRKQLPQHPAFMIFLSEGEPRKNAQRPGIFSILMHRRNSPGFPQEGAVKQNDWQGDDTADVRWKTRRVPVINQ